MVKNTPANAEEARDIEIQVQSLSWEDSLEKEMPTQMATHSSIFAWEIPWAEEPGRLQTMGLQEW